MRREAPSNKQCDGEIPSSEGQAEAKGSHAHRARPSTACRRLCPWLPLAHGAPSCNLHEPFLPSSGAERPTALLLAVTANRLCQ